jgi:hypothetical protein
MSTKKGLPILLSGEVIRVFVVQRVTNQTRTLVSLSGLYEENGPAIDIADKINASFPNLMMAGLGYRGAKLVAEADK